MPNLTFTERAQADMLQAWLYIADENLAAADGVLAAIERDAGALLLQPLMGRTRPELGRLVRSWPTSTPYILYYVSEKAGITVLRVLHHARDVRLASFDQ
ncbi:MAG: type II toxin-antitoxin system RelE/ParE family toxin [Gammaproteobacteria bacterium]|uniref:type II toxin-antitoxin system RelE/ParE family toxin n=1 Tax=Rhodoferax sp. TaxID=50421 RepID=UPI0017AF62E2|nr:type II toxin-antitoxin system RelE/ParE family toxin [Rhodoferax sp.]MBU3898706.1 type II toxin-antitoxin system RelE/ParE family toxin [Gammaproteobacteria bacterium]MBA3056459.1 type II toxin-antitoxin system RelE/ParE family toxin [Rhodoferax sp.]MBU3996122.1 type II toxin-antitoxin system RelE/ParE family toxin [Gammaproteobacteria bacterium]MBU4080823.1 type II toxin-antitoxin system RelE/ParE family toxin [Gammaproteobacteria bacterium]MBU4112468.1 type II toxin-antitoxin system RelE